MASPGLKSCCVDPLPAGGENQPTFLKLLQLKNCSLIPEDERGWQALPFYYKGGIQSLKIFLKISRSSIQNDFPLIFSFLLLRAKDLYSAQHGRRQASHKHGGNLCKKWRQYGNRLVRNVGKKVRFVADILWQVFFSFLIGRKGTWLQSGGQHFLWSMPTSKGLSGRDFSVCC